MAKTAAWNLAHTNVRVNSICPGLIEVRPPAVFLLFSALVDRLRRQPISGDGVLRSYHLIHRASSSRRTRAILPTSIHPPSTPVIALVSQ